MGGRASERSDLTPRATQVPHSGRWALSWLRSYIQQHVHYAPTMHVHYEAPRTSACQRVLGWLLQVKVKCQLNPACACAATAIGDQREHFRAYDSLRSLAPSLCTWTAPRELGNFIARCFHYHPATRVIALALPLPCLVPVLAL